MHREAMGQGALAEILLEQIGLPRVKFANRGHHLVQLGLHTASDNSLGPERKSIELFQTARRDLSRPSTSLLPRRRQNMDASPAEVYAGCAQQGAIGGRGIG
jgi:hypothetical protein